MVLVTAWCVMASLNTCLTLLRSCLDWEWESMEVVSGVGAADSGGVRLV